jgi:hypothetical protein
MAIVDCGFLVSLHEQVRYPKKTLFQCQWKSITCNLTLKEGYLKNAHWHLTRLFIAKETLNAMIKKDHQERKIARHKGPSPKKQQLIAQYVNDTNLI